jgi:hypothetical protein
MNAFEQAIINALNLDDSITKLAAKQPPPKKRRGKKWRRPGTTAKKDGQP